jgi:phage terminase small subunit|tara:strand:+ start:760 stop:1305 length:546 start_codon:yes stop_codon:yes gene_type:complete
MGLPKKLTEMQRQFANLLVANEGRKHAYECAIEAGYEKDRARQTAYELQNPKIYPLVVKYIGELREEFQKKYEVTYERHIAELAKIRDAALKKGAFSAAGNVEKSRGQAAGLYVEQKIIRTGKLDDMSKEEMETELKSIIDEYSPILEGVNVDTIKKNIEKKRLPRLKKVSSPSSPKDEES